MEVLLVSPVRPLKVVLAKMIPYFALSCFNLASILLLARFVLDVPLSGNLRGDHRSVDALPRPRSPSGC